MDTQAETKQYAGLKQPAPKAAVSWSAPEFVYTEKSADWFWAVGIIAISLVVSAILYGNPLIASLIGIGAVVFAIQAAKKPTTLKFSVDDSGVRAGDEQFKFSKIKSFWTFETEGGEGRLIIETDKLFTPQIVIPIRDVPRELVHSFLKSRVQEKEQSEPLPYLILERLGF